ncbi:MAG: hypothetical protein EOP07_03270 [Proteobacteria bacterium]|nr:MAG: hypothetical protein EOP07_03270 [Pseudomonadota bacterium]
MMKKCLLSAALALSVQGSAVFAQDTAVVSPAPVDPALTAAFLAADTAFAARDVASEGDVAAAAAAYPALEAALLPLETFPGIANTVAAEQAYAAIIPLATGSDLVRAVDGLYRTHNYQGIKAPLTYVPAIVGAETAKEIERKSEVLRKIRKSVFNTCWEKSILPIAPAAFGSSLPEYYYYRAACLSREAEASTLLERLANLSKLLGTFTDGFKVDNADTFEGGGLARVQAAVIGNPQAKGLPGLFKPEEALTKISASLEASSSDATILKTVEGFLYCENYLRKAITLNVLERTADAKATVAEAVDLFSTLDAGSVPEQIRAENNSCLEEITKYGASL